MEILKYRKDASSPWVEIAAIVGPKGADGTVSFDELTEEQKASLKGEPGADGATYTAGAGINISADNVISATGEDINLSNYYTKSEVNALIANIETYPSAEEVKY